MQRLLAALITALLNGSSTTRIEHNLIIMGLVESIVGAYVAGELGNSIIGREKSIISSCLTMVYSRSGILLKGDSYHGDCIYNVHGQ